VHLTSGLLLRKRMLSQDQQIKSKASSKIMNNSAMVAAVAAAVMIIAATGITAAVSWMTSINNSQAEKYQLGDGRLHSEAIASGLASLIVLQALSRSMHRYFTNAYLAQLIFMLSPVFTAIANKVLLRQPAPAQLWPTIILAVAGSGMVIAGSWISNGNTSSTLGGRTLSPQVSLIVGVSLALTSTLLLSLYLVLLQVTRHIVTGEQVLWAKRNVAAIVLVPLALAVDGTDWGWVRALTIFDWLVLVFTGIIIYTLANIWLQFCSRNLGAAVVSVFISLRLVASVRRFECVAEGGAQASAYLGWICVVVLVMTVFLLLQYTKKQHDARDANDSVLTSVVTSSEGDGSVTAVNTAPAAAAAAVTGMSLSCDDGMSGASSCNQLLQVTAGKSSDIV